MQPALTAMIKRFNHDGIAWALRTCSADFLWPKARSFFVSCGETEHWWNQRHSRWTGCRLVLVVLRLSPSTQFASVMRERMYVDDYLSSRAQWTIPSKRREEHVGRRRFETTTLDLKFARLHVDYIQHWAGRAQSSQDSFFGEWQQREGSRSLLKYPFRTLYFKVAESAPTEFTHIVRMELVTRSIWPARNRLSYHCESEDLPKSAGPERLEVDGNSRWRRSKVVVAMVRRVTMFKLHQHAPLCISVTCYKRKQVTSNLV